MQQYIVIEFQTNNEGQTSALPLAYEDIRLARQKYHTILAAAAVSELPVHGAMIVNPVNPEGLAMGIVEEYFFRRNGTAPADGD